MNNLVNLWSYVLLCRMVEPVDYCYGGIRQHGSAYSFFNVEDSLPLHCLKQLLLTLPVASVNQLEGAGLLS
jgi:hypothetical protein